jgi:tetratricopeptide (TPR) repeat protein
LNESATLNMNELLKRYENEKSQNNFYEMHLAANNIAGLYISQGDLNNAYRYHDLAVTHINRHLKMNPGDKQALLDKCIELRELGDICKTIKPEETLEHLKAAETICKKNEFNLELVNIYIIYFDYYEINEEFQECEKFYQKCQKLIEIEKQKKQKKDEVEEAQGNIYLMYGNLKLHLGEFELAEHYIKQAKNIHENLENNLRVADEIQSLASLSCKMKKFEEGIKQFEVARRKFSFLKQFSDEIDIVGNIGDAYFHLALYSDKKIEENLRNSKNKFLEQKKLIGQHCPTNQDKLKLNEKNLNSIQQIFDVYGWISLRVSEFKHEQDPNKKLEIMNQLIEKSLKDFQNSKLLLKFYNNAIAISKNNHLKSKFELISQKIEFLFRLVEHEDDQRFISELSKEINSAISLAELQNNRVYMEKFSQYLARFININQVEKETEIISIDDDEEIKVSQKEEKSSQQSVDISISQKSNETVSLSQPVLLSNENPLMLSQKWYEMILNETNTFCSSIVYRLNHEMESSDKQKSLIQLIENFKKEMSEVINDEPAHKKRKLE